jgi:Dockerin type I domain
MGSSSSQPCVVPAIQLTKEQAINSSQVGQGYHYITVEAFTHRTDGGPEVYTDWKQTVYIDLAPPNSAVTSFNSSSGSNSWTLQLASVDGFANNIHAFLDLPAADTNAQVLSLIGSSNQATHLDVNLWQTSYGAEPSGNHVVTIVSYKPDGTYGIQRFSASQDPMLSITTSEGAGIGDLNYDGTVNSTDINLFTSIVQSNNTQFNPAADVNGDGMIDLADTFLLGPILTAHAVDQATWTAYNNFIYGAYVESHAYNLSGSNVIYQDTAATTNALTGSLLNASYVRGTALNISSGAVVQIKNNPTFGSGTSKISSLSIAGTTSAWTGQLDLANNPLVLESTTANRSADLVRVSNMVQQGFSGGTWTGRGITSSVAAADTTHLHALGVILNDNGQGSPLYPNFYGQAADDNAILISYTYVGDTNLDGKIDGSDYSRIDNGYLHDLTGWANGDFNYDGVVNGTDYTLIDNAFNTQGAAGAAPAVILTNQFAIETAQIASSPVPEPAGISLCAVALTVLSRRRKLKR